MALTNSRTFSVFVRTTTSRLTTGVLADDLSLIGLSGGGGKSASRSDPQRIEITRPARGIDASAFYELTYVARDPKVTLRALTTPVSNVEVG